MTGQSAQKRAVEAFKQDWRKTVFPLTLFVEIFKSNKNPVMRNLVFMVLILKHPRERLCHGYLSPMKISQQTYQFLTNGYFVMVFNNVKLEFSRTKLVQICQIEHLLEQERLFLFNQYRTVCRLRAMRIFALKFISESEELSRKRRGAKCPRGDTQSCGELFSQSCIG